ncbi:hypothetical protein EYZ11_004289 [Aspergillus tanneri]|uniref:Uncharacterized protein n=1 Tax=Aspergillus tanneri TaxID=1220188 RepID=A0A4S3JRR0_9EURO|nr:uncharacterized protein ATNIH1004_003678 [Aspergillus tanneri]KAA8650987.1 hypothetical protein ATNIH1004_003678 [Aspergillus tanneri]THC96211.1 hypothetical protein EYZ11_004289 [Aspergillus tanneri]
MGKKQDAILTTRQGLTNCVICGSPIQFSRPEDWKEWSHILVPRTGQKITAEELEQADYSTVPSLAMSFYRIILHDPDGSLHVSGITQSLNKQRHRYRVPYNTQDVRLGASASFIWPRSREYEPGDLQADKYTPSGKRRGWAYPMHMPCWVLLRQMMSTQVVEQNLSYLLQTLSSFWRHGQGVHWTPIPRLVKYRAARWDVEVDWATANPVWVPEIQVRLKMARKTPPPMKRLPPDHPIGRVPVEIAMFIADLILSDTTRPMRGRDTHYMLWAFRWTLPDAYWKARCRTALLLEVDQILRSEESVDWQFLAISLVELPLNTNNALLNRHRLLGFLGCMQEEFQQRINGVKFTESDKKCGLVLKYGELNAE